MNLFMCKAPDLRGKEKPNQPVEVKVPKSYTYNGGTIINGEWYAGFSVPDPILPEGYELASIGVGLQLNAKPPYATLILRKKK